MIEMLIEIGLEILWNLLYVAEGYFFYRILACLMRPREQFLLRLAGGAMCTVVVNVIVYPGDVVNITGMLPLFLLATLVAFDSSWLVRVSVVMLFYPIVIGLNYMMYEIFGRTIIALFGVGTAENAFWSGVTCVIPVALWYLYQRFLKKQVRDVREFLDAHAWIMLDVICLASMAAVYTCVYYAPTESYKLAPCMAACMITNIGSIRLASYLADSLKAGLERKNLRLQQNYYEELEKNQLEIRRLRHDMKNQFAVAGQLLAEKKYQEAETYFEHLSGHMETRNRKFCENSIVNALLNLKYNAAMEAEIDCFFHIEIDGMTGVDDITLCVIFGNTLDNAIEACLKMKDAGKRRLSVKARYAKNYFSYEIVNTKENEIRRKKERFLTDKEDGKEHGLGVASVKDAVRRYGGTMDISYTEEEFRVVILMEV